MQSSANCMKCVAAARMYEKTTGANDLIRAQILLAHSVSPLRTVKIFKANLRCARSRREAIAVVVCATWRPLRAGRRQAYLAEKFLGSALSAQDRVLSPSFSAGAMPTSLFGIPIEFMIFAVMLLGVAFFNLHVLAVAVCGVAVILVYNLLVTGVKFGPGIGSIVAHRADEWVILTNMFLLLIVLGLLSRHFEKTRIPAALPRILPHDWKGAFWLLIIVFVLSSFLDNIAAALIGGAMAHTLFRAKVHVGYLAAIVAASNAGGSGSVVGDTTTTMMWIDGVNPLDVLHGYAGAVIALAVFGIPAAIQQQRYSPILKHEHQYVKVDWPRVGIVTFILTMAIAVNVIINVQFPDFSDSFPFIGTSVACAVLITAPVRRPDWEIMPESIKGSVFLLSLVLCAT